MTDKEEEIFQRERVKQLKKLIEDNYIVEVYLDPYNRLWITHEKLRIDIQIINDQPWIGVRGEMNGERIQDDCVCDQNDTVIYFLLKYCKKSHKWGKFENKN
jgi:hypothetical protein